MALYILGTLTRDLTPEELQEIDEGHRRIQADIASGKGIKDFLAAFEGINAKPAS